MEIESNNIQEENERIFTDYLARQSITDPRQFTFDIDSYRSHYPQAAQQIIKDPTKYYRLIKKYLQKDPSYQQIRKKTDSKIQHFNIKIEGNLGANFVTPRGLSSRMANQLAGLQGIITKIDLPKKYLQKSVHYCQATKSTQMREYPDAFNPEKDVELGRTRNIKSYDQNNNPLQFQYGFSTFKNMQMAVIQQLPEMAPPGLLPMSVQVVLQNKLIDSVKPGDRVQMIGIYKLIAGLNTKEKGIFKPYFLCLSVKPLTQVASMMKKPSKLDFIPNQIFDLFSRSIAPSVWGHQYLKKAVLLMLVGGVQKVTPNNTHLRGDINLLMIGDPGTAKSQMLRWVLSTVDVSVGTTGSGASGVGLTAAIVTDRQTGQKTLQAGAMVLADRGVVCIDQFDKMNETDRVAVHEVMEQQTVTIAKAGLHCSLNARCAVIAAANPIYGQYQQNMAPTKNIGMPDSLLSRFDLIFIIKDQKSSARDHQIAQKVCRNHRLAPQSNDFFNQYLDPTQYIVQPIEDRRMENEDQPFQKNNVYRSEGKAQILNQAFLKSYINYVKHNIEPVMSNEAVNLCGQLWTLLRQKDSTERQTTHAKVLPITIRSLQSLIRLSTAHAKLRQSLAVQIFDVIQGFKLMVYCLYGQQNALQQDIKITLKTLNYHYDLQATKRIVKDKNPVFEPKEQQKSRKMQEQQLRQRMIKLDIRRDQQQINELLRKEREGSQKVSFTKDQRALVYKKLVELNKKVKGQKLVKLSQLQNNIDKKITPEKLQAILDDLQEQNKLTTDKGNIYVS